MLEELGGVRDQILDYAELKPGDRLLDVGCGDGLIGFGALVREPGCSVVFSDVSKRLVDQCRQLAAASGLTERGRFLVAAAEDLSRVDDGSIDVVTTRSVLIYVEVKLRAFQEFYRVLRPGGRISLSEPINRYFVQPDGSRPPAFEPGPVKDLADRVRAVFMRAAPGAMMDFDDRDLVRLIEQAGFQEVHLRLHVDEPRAERERSARVLVSVVPPARARRSAHRRQPRGGSPIPSAFLGALGWTRLSPAGGSARPAGRHLLQARSLHRFDRVVSRRLRDGCQQPRRKDAESARANLGRYQDSLARARSALSPGMGRSTHRLLQPRRYANSVGHRAFRSR